MIFVFLCLTYFTCIIISRSIHVASGAFQGSHQGTEYSLGDCRWSQAMWEKELREPQSKYKGQGWTFAEVHPEWKQTVWLQAGALNCQYELLQSSVILIPLF